MTNKILLTIISLTAIFGFLFIVYFFVNGTNESATKETTMIKSSDHAKWAGKPSDSGGNSKNLLVEYSDYQCPACQNLHNELEKIQADKNNADILKNITFVYRHYPLVQHPNAAPAAYAAEAAGKQNKFFEMSDLIFDSQTEWASIQNPNEFFSNLAKKLKLDMDKFKKDFESSEVRTKVQEDVKSGNAVGIQATPTIFLNGKLIEIRKIPDFIKLLKETAKI